MSPPQLLLTPSFFRGVGLNHHQPERFWVGLSSMMRSPHFSIYPLGYWSHGPVEIVFPLIAWWLSIAKCKRLPEDIGENKMSHRPEVRFFGIAPWPCMTRDLAAGISRLAITSHLCWLHSSWISPFWNPQWLHHLAIHIYIYIYIIYIYKYIYIYIYMWLYECPFIAGYPRKFSMFCCFFRSLVSQDFSHLGPPFPLHSALRFDLSPLAHGAARCRRFSNADHGWRIMGKNMGKSWENHGKIMGNLWENHRKIIGKSWENHGKIMGTWEIYGEIMGKTWEHGKFMVFLMLLSWKMHTCFHSHDFIWFLVVDVYCRWSVPCVDWAPSARDAQGWAGCP